jgi:hypothetical protein
MIHLEGKNAGGFFSKWSCHFRSQVHGLTKNGLLILGAYLLVWSHQDLQIGVQPAAQERR